MSAVTIFAEVTTSTSVRWPPTRTVLPCQCGVWALKKSPSVARVSAKDDADQACGDEDGA